MVDDSARDAWLLNRALSQIRDMHEQAEKKHGVNNHHPMVWLSICGEEFGEMCKAANEMHFDGAGAAQLRAELVDLAVSAVGAIVSLDKQFGVEALIPKGAQDR